MEKPLVNKEFLLEKFQGKGGWTFAAIPEILQNPKAPFGWVTVKGSIDNFELKNYKLMPMGNGKLFLPVKAEIRKKIGKKEGDWVKIILYADNSFPEEFLICLHEDSNAKNTFLTCTESEQKALVHWIYACKNEDEKIERIAKVINKLAAGEKKF